MIREIVDVLYGIALIWAAYFSVTNGTALIGLIVGIFVGLYVRGILVEIRNNLIG